MIPRCLASVGRKALIVRSMRAYQEEEQEEEVPYTPAVDCAIAVEHSC